MNENLFIPDPDTNDFVFDGHAGAGPSGAERWMTCTASLGATRKFLETLTPNQQQVLARASTAARQGTTAHAVAEAEVGLLLGALTPEEVATTLLELSVLPEDDGEAYDAEMAGHLTEYVDLVKQYHDAGREVLVEERVTAEVPLTGLYLGTCHHVAGSADCIVKPTKKERDLVVADLKYGAGIDVSVEENPQIRIYALGALALLTPKERALVEQVTYYIVQPRAGGIKEWSETLHDLLVWRDTVLAPALTAALHGLDEGAEFRPSETTCQWCLARGTCPALAEQRVAQAADLFDTVVEAEYADGPGAFPDVTLLDDERLGSLLTQINGLMEIQKDLKAEAERRLHRGTEVPGFKLVGYTPKRRWQDGADVALALVGPVWQRSLLSPKKALDALKAAGMSEEQIERVTDLIDAPLKVPIIAPEGDRRKEWDGQYPERMFPDDPDVSGNEEKAWRTTRCR